MSTLVSKPETIIKPESAMPSPTMDSPTHGEASRMNNKGTGLISPPLSSNSSEAPPKSPTHSKSGWPNAGNHWNGNLATGPTHYQAATQNYAAVPRRQHGPYALDRGDGTVSRLIPADELPFDIVGVPRREAPGSFSVVTGQASQGPPYQVVRMDRGQGNPPQVGLGLSRMDYQIPQELRTGPGLPYDPSTISHSQAIAGPLYDTEALQNQINNIVAARPRVQQRPQKEYCDKWLQTGNCGFQQVGCKYKHIMPMDRVTQDRVGLNGLPDWYTKSHGISLRPSPQGAREKSWRNRETEMGGMRAGAGLPSREFGMRPAVIPNRKPVPVTRQIGGPPEGLASQLDARVGAVTLEGSADRRTMTPGFSDLAPPFGVEARRDFGAIGDRLNTNTGTLSSAFPSPSRIFGSGSGAAAANHYALLGEMADQRDKKFEGSGGLDDDSQSDYSGGITPF